MTKFPWLLAGWNELLIASFSHRSISVKDGILLATGLHVHRNSAHSAGVGAIFDRWGAGGAEGAGEPALSSPPLPSPGWGRVGVPAPQLTGSPHPVSRVLTELVSKMRDMRMDKTELGCLRAIILFNPGAWAGTRLRQESRAEP